MQIPSELHESLNRFGLNEAEIAVYLALLELGPRPASVVAKKAHLKRGHAYNVLNGLTERGIVQQFEKNHVRYYTGSSPHSLLTILENRADELKRQKESLMNFLPLLENLRNPNVTPPKVRFFQGFEGVREAMEDSLRAGVKDVYAFLDVDRTWRRRGVEVYDILTTYARKRVEREINIHLIIPALPDPKDPADPFYLTEYGFRELKIFPGLSLFSEIIVYGDRVQIISTENQMIALIIEDATIASSVLSLHQTLWKMLPTMKNESLGPRQPLSEPQVKAA